MAEKLRPLLTLLKDILYGVLLWLLIITFVGQVREVPTGSMEPTILVGDRFWTDKLVLRFTLHPPRGHRRLRPAPAGAGAVSLHQAGDRPAG